jgi:hypothetical protein
LIIDLFQRTESLFAVGAAVDHPVSRFAIGSDDASAVHVRRLAGPLFALVFPAAAPARRENHNTHEKQNPRPST